MDLASTAVSNGLGAHAPLYSSPALISGHVGHVEVGLAAPLVPANQAISLPDMVQAICIELRPLLASHQVTLLFSGQARAVPLVFGHRDQLRAALWECVEAAIVHARLEVNASRSLAMEILFMTDADQVHLIIRSLGAIEEITLTADGAAAEPVASLLPSSAELTELRQRLVFPFARLSLHSLGGQVSVSQPEGAGVECTVSLPLAAPSAAADQPDHHAQVYAGLLTRLTHAALLGPASRADGFSR